MSALDIIDARYAQPDRTNAFYAVQRILEDHPATRDLRPDAINSLAQRCVEAVRAADGAE